MREAVRVSVQGDSAGVRLPAKSPSSPRFFAQHRAWLQLIQSSNTLQFCMGLAPSTSQSLHTCVRHYSVAGVQTHRPTRTNAAATWPGPPVEPSLAGSLSHSQSCCLPLSQLPVLRSPNSPQQSNPCAPLTVYSRRRSLARRGKDSSRPGNRRAAGISTEQDPLNSHWGSGPGSRWAGASATELCTPPRSPPNPTPGVGNAEERAGPLCSAASPAGFPQLASLAGSGGAFLTLAAAGILCPVSVFSPGQW